MQSHYQGTGTSEIKSKHRTEPDEIQGMAGSESKNWSGAQLWHRKRNLLLVMEMKLGSGGARL